MMDSGESQRIEVGFKDFQDDGGALNLLHSLCREHALATEIVHGILELMPDPSLWSLTISGDLVKTVNALQSGTNRFPYAIERGSGFAGAITLPNGDGTFTFVVSDQALLTTRETVHDFQQLASHARAAGAHLGRHEAGHALLASRGDAAAHVQGTPGLDPTSAAFWPMIRAHVDDNRIEQYTMVHAPSPNLQTDGLARALEHFVSELFESRMAWRQDIVAARDRTLAAANHMLGVIAYLVAELGFDADGNALRPAVLPSGWAEVLEPSWEHWARAYRRLRPVDEEMALSELGSAMADLCRLASVWLSSVGVAWNINDEGEESMYWDSGDIR